MCKYYLIKTYGCQMNVHESEKLAGMLISLGYEETQDDVKADIIIFNTCCIRDGAEQKVFAHIGATKNLKKVKKDLIVCVCGCMSQSEGKAEIIKKKFPHVSIIIGTHNIHKFKEYLENFLQNKKFICDIWTEEKGINEDVDMYRTSGENAWVNISYGCNNFCTYCIVPYVRGRERSRNVEDIIDEVKCLIKQGYKTITLLGQNVNSYGNDIDDNSINFANLLKACANLDGDFRIKFMTSHPKDLTDEVINAVAYNDKLAKVIHLPVQSGSNKILKLMNRKYTREHYLDLIEKIRTKIPNCYLSTDIIVGFPDETDEDFNDTCSLVKNVRYDGVFAFMYSVRTGTLAKEMPNQVPQEIKNKRVNELLKLTKSITKEKDKESVGKIYEVLTGEKLDKDLYLSSTLSGKTIYINSDTKIQKDRFYKVEVTEYKNNKVFGKIKD